MVTIGQVIQQTSGAKAPPTSSQQSANAQASNPQNPSGNQSINELIKKATESFRDRVVSDPQIISKIPAKPSSRVTQIANSLSQFTTGNQPNFATMMPGISNPTSNSDFNSNPQVSRAAPASAPPMIINNVSAVASANNAGMEISGSSSGGAIGGGSGTVSSDDSFVSNNSNTNQTSDSSVRVNLIELETSTVT